MTLETLREYGIEPMDDEAIRDFLAHESVGVLGLPDEEVPYLVPLSYAYDGDSTLYFTYLVGDGSRKVAATDRAERAQFLVYTAESPFRWRSVLVTGGLEAVPPDEVDEVAALDESSWRPAVFERATESVEVTVYRFRVTEQEGLRHTGLPPGMTDEE